MRKNNKPNHSWHVISRQDVCVKCVETSGDAYDIRIILAEIDRNLRIVVYHHACNVLVCWSSVHFQVKWRRLITMPLAFVENGGISCQDTYSGSLPSSAPWP